ncbi:restriction endonuclease subunit S [Heyndrickxia coagulans]|uniref:restriction endonuclease subunit S n=1 Tax=Heyndrickxia coagulans TaxID=1398 RepID=UPI00353068EE
MMEQKNLVPKRRFKEFQNTSAWEQRRLGDVAEISAGGDIDKTKLSGFGKYPVIANALTNDGIIGYYENDFRIEAPAVTVTGRGDVGHAQARKTNFTPVVRLLSVKSKHDVDFLEHAINKHKVLVESTGVPQLTSPQLANYKIWFTSLEEEKKIGRFFCSLDNLITLHQRKLEKMKAIKSAYLSEMFPAEGERVPKRRFAGFTQAWEQRKLGDMVEEIIDNRGKTPPIVSSSQYPLLEVASLGNDTPDYSKVTKYVDKETYKNWFRQHIKKGDILFATVGNTGVTAMMDGAHQATIAQNIVGFRPNEKFNSEFMLQMFNLPGNLKKAKRIEMGAVQPSVKVSQLIDVKYSVPSKEEQVKVGTFFANLDHLITLHQRKLEKLQNIKKAYLNEMFV